MENLESLKKNLEALEEYKESLLGKLALVEEYINNAKIRIEEEEKNPSNGKGRVIKV